MVAAPVLIDTPERLPDIIDAARNALEGARTSAQVLEARDMAAVAYDAASRFTRRKAAFDHMTALAMRMQAQALRIEARAKERLAEEYDAAQERGEVSKGGGRPDCVADANAVPATAADLGLRRDEIHEARKLRDAERADPGAIDRSIDQRLASGEAPTRTSLKRDLGIIKPKPAPPPAPESHAEMMRRVVPALVGQLQGNPLLMFEKPGCEAFDLAVEVLRSLPETDIRSLRNAVHSLSLLLGELHDD